MDLKALLRRAHMFSLEDFKTLWASVRELVVIETLDDKGKPQGEALVRMDQLYQADADGAFAKVSYVACSDEYYQWWVDHDMGPNTFHHFCRHDTLKGCMAKTGREGIVHVLQWTPVTRPEAETVLREWGYSPSLLGRTPRSLPAPLPDRRVVSESASKSSPLRPPPGLEKARTPALRNLETRPGPDQDEEHEEEGEAHDRRVKKSGRARPVSPPPPPPRKQRPQDSGGAALDKMLDEDPHDADSDKLRGDAHERLATLREDLQRRKAARGKSDPGAVLATRAAAVAETAGKKRKSSQGDKMISALTKALKKKTVKEEIDYGDEAGHSGSSDGSDSEEDEKRLLGGSLGSGSAVAKQRKLRQLSEKKPGRLLQTGYASMHEQVGTYFGNDEANKDVLTPVALRYLLSYALPQFRNGVSHDKYRELRTLATCLDHLVAGPTGQAGDFLLQRYKALLMTQRDGSDAASRFIELLPEENMPTMASSSESYLARSLAVHQAKSDELLRRAST